MNAPFQPGDRVREKRGRLNGLSYKHRDSLCCVVECFPARWSRSERPAWRVRLVGVASHRGRGERDGAFDAACFYIVTRAARQIA